MLGGGDTFVEEGELKEVEREEVEVEVDEQVVMTKNHDTSEYDDTSDDCGIWKREVGDGWEVLPVVSERVSEEDDFWQPRKSTTYIYVGTYVAFSRRKNEGTLFPWRDEWI